MRPQHLVERVDDLGDAQLLDVAHGGGELTPEIPQQVAPSHLVVGDAVELLLEAGGEIVFHVAGEEAFEERGQHPPLVLGHQPLLLDAHVAAVLEYLQDRGVGRGPADAELLHALDQRGFRVARRRLGEMLAGVDLALGEALSGAHLGETAALLVGRDVVLALLIERQKAVELHHRPGRAQIDDTPRGVGGDIRGGALELGGFHLARDHAQPNQFVEPRLVVIEERFHLARAARHIGRPDRLVRLLRVFCLGLVLARRRRHVALAVVGADQAAGGGKRLFRDVDAVGAHIGNEADGLAVDLDAFVEPLRDAHGVRGRKAELAACFLLQRRGGEGRRRIALGGLGLDVGHRERGALQCRLERLGLGGGADVEPLDFLAVGADEARLEFLSPRRRQRRHQRPVFARDEFLDLELAVADEPQRHRLHPAGRARAGELAPQHRREREPHEVVERAAGEIGVDQGAIDLARVLHRVEHRLLGDGVEHHPLDRVRLERVLLLQRFEHVPGNRLAFAIGVGGEDQLVGPLQGAGNVVEALLGLVVDLPDHAEIVLGVDRAVLGREVAHVPERGQYLVAGAKVAIDRFRLGRRLDNYDVHAIPIS